MNFKYLIKIFLLLLTISISVLSIYFYDNINKYIKGNDIDLSKTFIKTFSHDIDVELSKVKYLNFITNLVLTDNSQIQYLNVDRGDVLQVLHNIPAETFQKYILETLNKDESNMISKLLKKELSFDAYKIDGVPVDISFENSKGALLYHLSFRKKNRIFYQIKDFRKRVLYTNAYLSGVANIETGKHFNFDHREFSKTLAYGRFQVVASTLAPIMIKLYMEEGFDINSKESKIDTTFYSLINDYTKMMNTNFSEKYDERWSKKNVKRQFNNYLKYSKRLNHNYIKSMEKQLRFLRSHDGKSAKSVKKALFYDKKGNIDTYKQFEFSSKILDLIVKAEYQAIVSCFVLEDIYMRILYKKPRIAMENLLFKTLEQYNNDFQMIVYKGKKQPLRKVYAKHVKKDFKNNTKEFDEISDTKIWKKDEVLVLLGSYPELDSYLTPKNDF